MNYCRPGDTPEMPEEYISLLKRYAVLVPHLISTVPKELNSQTLFRPDLHLDIYLLIRKQSTSSTLLTGNRQRCPKFFFQHKVPPTLPFPTDYNEIQDIPSGVPKTVNHPNEDNDIFNYYQTLTRTKNPLRWAAINLPNGSTLTEPTSLVSGTWSRNNLFSFRHALITIAARGKNISPYSASCPISFTKEELELHNEEMELLEELGTVLQLLQDQNLIEVGGRVLREDYDRAKAVNKRVKEMLLDMADNEQQKALYEKIWPY